MTIVSTTLNMQSKSTWISQSATRMKRLYSITHNYFICRLVINKCKMNVMRKQSDVFHNLCHIHEQHGISTHYVPMIFPAFLPWQLQLMTQSGENYLHQLVPTMTITMHAEWWVVVNNKIPVTSALSMTDTHQLDIFHLLPWSININTTYIPVVQPMPTIHINC